MTTCLSFDCRRFTALVSLLVIGAVLSSAACSNDVIRRDVAASLTEEVVAPSYEATAAAANELHVSIERLQDNPTSASLTDARAAW